MKILVAFLALWLMGVNAAFAAQPGRIAGTVQSAERTPVSGALLLFASKLHEYRATSDVHGNFVVEQVPADTYDLSITAPHYQPVSGRLVGVQPGQTSDVTVVLQPLIAGAMASLGTVVVNGNVALSKASAPSIELDPQDLAGKGVEQLSEILSQQIALTMTRPAGGAPGLPQSAALRGPDPSETVIDVDGHQVNNSNSGDFDLSLLDPSEFSNVQVVYGIGPSSLVGANTQGGAINFHTIDPTPNSHGLIRVSAGSFNTFGATLQATGASDRLGYALSVHRYTTSGEVNNYAVINNANGSTATLGSSILATSSLAKLRYALGVGDGFIEATYRNIIATRDLSGPLATPDNPFAFSQGSSFTVLPDARSQNIAPALGLDVQLPFGHRDAGGVAPATLIFRHEDSVNSQSVPADVEVLANPYLFNQRDRVLDDSISYDRTLTAGSLTFSYDVRRESLTSPAALAPGPGDQTQSGRSFVGRYEWRPSPKLDLTAGAYASDFDTFGRSLDPRLAAVWTPSGNQVFRASVGTAFRAPLLAERVFNPNLTAERTTQYELGYERLLGEGPLATHAVVNLYRTNLRNPIFFSVDATGALTFLKNLGNVVYQGVELRVDKPLTTKLTLHGAYGSSIAYPINNPFAFDPAAPNVVQGQQFQGIPPQKAQLSLTGRTDKKLGYFFSGAYESRNNELNRPPYVTLAAGIAKSIGHTQIGLSARNLTNRYDNLFTLPNAGTPYPTPLGPAPTNAYSLQGTSLTLTVTQRY